jgi:hypothetical protein
VDQPWYGGAGWRCLEWVDHVQYLLA